MIEWVKYHQSEVLILVKHKLAFVFYDSAENSF